jgi:Spy/CpxP family protein refolding chaperone
MKSMKQKLLATVAGLVVLVAPFTATTAKAQSANDFPILSGIELTQSQEEQFAQLRSQVRTQIEGILTPEQITQFKTSLEQRQGLRTAIASMNLSQSQKQDLRSIFQSARTQVSNTLTPAQKQQLRENIRARFRDFAQ